MTNNNQNAILLFLGGSFSAIFFGCKNHGEAKKPTSGTFYIFKLSTSQKFRKSKRFQNVLFCIYVDNVFVRGNKTGAMDDVDEDDEDAFVNDEGFFSRVRKNRLQNGYLHIQTINTK